MEKIIKKTVKRFVRFVRIRNFKTRKGALKLLQKLKNLWLKLVSYFFPRWKLTVSYNQTWGDSDDREFVVKKFFKKQPKFLKFKTHEGEIIEIMGAEGLNYRIESI
tara:strand:- start:141 stop:458 length:318 start_codon:yes stop_codon:yes gene_type:complete